MNTTEYLLSKLAEECAEVTQRATKAQRFGLDEVQPGQYLNNRQRLTDEVEDLLVILSMLEDRGIVVLDHLESAVDEKEAKILKYMEYSRQCGTLVDDVKPASS